MSTAATPEDTLKALGIALPQAPAPLGSYVPFVRTGNLLFLSGILPLREGSLTITGTVGAEVSVEEAQAAARQVAVNALALVKSALGDLGRISRCVKLNGYVASAPGFVEQPKVLNGASELLAEVLGEAGRHARAAVGVASLPLNAPLEIDFVFEVIP